MLNRALFVLGRLFLLNVIYILTVAFSLGILVAPATSALFYCTKDLLNKDTKEYGFLKQYMNIIKTKFRFSFWFGLMAALILYLCIVNLDNVLLMNYPSWLLKTIVVFQYIIIVETSLMTVMVLFLNGLFLFSKFSDLLKMAFFILHRHFFTTLIMVITITVLVYVFVFYLNAFLLLLFFSVVYLWINLLYWPIVNKYIVKKEEKPEYEQKAE
ncbi:MAG: DUF624 domain-containing protein [Bacilli bacterium]